MGFSAPPMGSSSNKQQNSTVPQGGGQMTPQQGVSSFNGGVSQPHGNTLPSGNMSINDPRVMELLHGGTGMAQLFSHGNPFGGSQGVPQGSQTSPTQPQMTPQQGMSTFGGGFNGMNPMMAQLLQRRGMG